MRESRMLGSVRGALSNGCPYRDPRLPTPVAMTPIAMPLDADLALQRQLSLAMGAKD